MCVCGCSSVQEVSGSGEGRGRSGSIPLHPCCIHAEHTLIIECATYNKQCQIHMPLSLDSFHHKLRTYVLSPGQ